MRPVRDVKTLVIVLGVLLTLVAGCSKAPDMRPVALPELSRLDVPVQTQIRQRYETLTHAIGQSSTPVAELASAYGEYGMVLQAAEFFDAAEPPYQNAQALVPDEVRWPYYLANLYKSRGETDKAEAAFKRALALQPDDLATLIWLGRLNLDQGKTDAALALFQKAAHSRRAPWPWWLAWAARRSPGVIIRRP